MLHALILVAIMAVQAADSDLQQCASISSDSERLACYDALAGRGTLHSPTDSGEWDVSRKTNPLDDSVTITATLTASEGRNRRGRAPVLVARCTSSGVDAYIAWDDYLGNDVQPVTLRIGNRPADTDEWSISTDKKATFAPRADRFLIKLAAAERLVVQTTPYNESPITATFALNGIDAAVTQMAEGCPELRE